jgi:hypothetical protein
MKKEPCKLFPWDVNDCNALCYIMAYWRSVPLQFQRRFIIPAMHNRSPCSSLCRSNLEFPFSPCFPHNLFSRACHNSMYTPSPTVDLNIAGCQPCQACAQAVILLIEPATSIATTTAAAAVVFPRNEIMTNIKVRVLVCYLRRFTVQHLRPLHG